MIEVKIMEGPISYTCLLEGLDEPSHGAKNIFFGTVRDHNHGKEVEYLEYDLHETFAPIVMEEICQEAIETWGSELNIRLYHSKGTIHVAEASVGMVVSSPHRKEVFLASQYIIEELKKRVPIWKNEKYTQGESGWLDGNSLCRCPATEATHG